MPPHFHVVANDGREWLIRIDNGEVLEGARSTRSIRAALEWAAVPTNRSRLLHIFGSCTHEKPGSLSFNQGQGTEKFVP